MCVPWLSMHGCKNSHHGLHGPRPKRECIVNHTESCVLKIQKDGQNCPTSMGAEPWISQKGRILIVETLSSNWLCMGISVELLAGCFSSRTNFLHAPCKEVATPSALISMFACSTNTQKCTLVCHASALAGFFTRLPAIWWRK